MLQIQKRPEPAGLAGYRSRADATWDDVEDKDRLRDALCAEQAHLCAYCQRRIRPDWNAMKIEHWSPRNPDTGDGDALTFVWSNLLGVCPGQVGGVAHCDTSKGNRAIALHPVQGQGGASPRAVLRYQGDGTIACDDARYQGDLATLNLNARHLVEGRSNVVQALKKRLSDKKRGAWSREALQREQQRLLDALQGEVQAPEYVEVALYQLRRWIKAR